MNSPHVHPRATEFNVAINGSLYTGLLSENESRFIVNNVPPLSATIFNRGAIHFEANLGCEEAIFIAAFNHEDPGVQQVAQRCQFFHPLWPILCSVLFQSLVFLLRSSVLLSVAWASKRFKVWLKWSVQTRSALRSHCLIVYFL